MASSDFNDCNSKLSDQIDKPRSKIHSHEHEESLKSDQMASKEIDEKAHIEDFDETQLKSLLEEAMDYKSPRDANDKSEIFKQLLKNVTEEDSQRNENYMFGLKQSNSLQNLLDDSHYQSGSHQSHPSGKKNHHQRRKNSSTVVSVSSRSSQGGSLPIDMHHSSAVQSPPDQPFLNELKLKKRKEKQQKDTVIDIGENETDEKKLMQRHFEVAQAKDGISSSYPHDGIEMKPYYTNKVDLELQETYPAANTITTISSISAAGGMSVPTASILNSKMASSAAMNNSESVDKAIEYSLMEQSSSYNQQQKIIYTQGLTDGLRFRAQNQNNHIVLANPGLNFTNSSKYSGVDESNLQLNSSHNAVQSLMSNDKTSSKTYSKIHEGNSPPAINHGTLTQGSALTSSKDGKSKQKRTSKSERNEKIIDINSIQGFRGTDEVEDLLKYIEAGDGKSQKSHPKNGIVATSQASEQLLSAEEKKRKMAAKNKEKVNKLKKSNSMDELCSTGRQEQQQEEKSSSAANKINQDVTLRSKSSNLASGAKKGEKNNDKSQPKRNERRSWGTEGLWTDASDQHRDNQEESHEVESTSSSTSCGVPNEQIKITQPLTIANVETSVAIVSETEFHVVTKKRKVKRKSNDGGDISKVSNNLQGYNIKRDANIRQGPRTYNDRDMNSKNARNAKPSNQDSKSSTGKNRRKSTSSMPPSDDDWNSDGGDSVQSLPIETTKTTSSQLLSTTIIANDTALSSGGKSKKNSHQSHQQQLQQQKPATFSYADIAKTNANRNNGTNVTTSTEKWPSITASSSSNSNATHQNIIDPFSIANFDAVNNPSSNAKTHQHQHQQQHQKSAPVVASSMSFPELVETNNNKNKQLSSNSSSSSENASNGGDSTNNTTEKPMNGLDAPRAFDTNNNSNDDRINNNQKISYSQSLLENHQEVDSNGNTIHKLENTTTVPSAKAMLTKSKSVDHNNLSSIEQYPALEKTRETLSELFSKPPVTFETNASKSKQKQIKLEVKLPINKKDKLKKSSSVQNPQYPQQSLMPNSRPAVIILNDIAKPSDVDCGITFGFDINEHLLFGQENGIDVGGEVCILSVNSETNNNNNNCDTNLSSNYNLTNQPCSGSGHDVRYENFNVSHNIVIGDGHIMTLSQSSPKQHQNNALDSSNHSSNDMGYLSSSLINNSTSPSTLKTTSSLPNDEHIDSKSDDAKSQQKLLEVKGIAKMEDCKLVLPQFVATEPCRFNQDELVAFLCDEWTKVSRNAPVFKGQ